jgi:hypothetical protein
MGRGSSTPSPFGQMGDRPAGMPNFDASGFRDRMDQFRSSHPFPANPGFPFPGGVPGGRPPTSVPPIPTPTPGNEGTFPGGGHTGGVFPGPGDWPGGGGGGGGGNAGVFPGSANDGVFPGGGATGGAFPGGAGANPTPPRNFPQGSTGNTMGRVGQGYGPISGRPETLDRSFGPTGGKRGSNQ